MYRLLIYTDSGDLLEGLVRQEEHGGLQNAINFLILQHVIIDLHYQRLAMRMEII